VKNKVAIGVIATLFAAACATKLIYQRLDTLIGWRLNDYVTLDDQQRRDFKRAFADLWKWHRTHELPKYAQDLREIARELDGRAISAEEVGARSAQFQAHWSRLMDEAVTRMCPIVRTLSDKQAQEILDGVDDNLSDFRKEYVDPDEKELRSKSAKRTGKWIKRWTGPLNDVQEALLRTWGEKRLSLGAEWLAQRQHWRGELAKALAQRRDSPDCDGFRPLFVEPRKGVKDGFARDLAHNEKLWNELIAEVIADMDDRQRARTRDEIGDFAGQLEQLSTMQQP